jgi:hypothetical protein
MRILIAALLLSACSAQTPHPIVDVPVTVKVPIAVPCYSASDIPTEPAKVGKDLTGDAMHDLDIVAASAFRLRAWGQSEAALLSGCTIK